MESQSPPRVLTIAGSDSSGGAGIEADLKVMTVHGVYGMTAITALTAQNTKGVNDVHVVPHEFLAKEIAACLDDVGVDAVKTGMLACEENIKAVVQAIRDYKLEGKVVVDPVMISTTNHELLPREAVRAYLDDLLPVTYILTPNVPEALLLLQDSKPINPERLEDCIALAKDLHKLGPKYVVLKGGHCPFKKVRKAKRARRQDLEGVDTNYEYITAKTEEEREVVVDVVYDGNKEGITLVESKWVETKCTHGTGCSLASAIASNLALKYSPVEAIRLACTFVSDALQSTIPNCPKNTLGKGSTAPINHLHRIQRLLEAGPEDTSSPLPFKPGGFIPWLVEHPKIKDVWYGYTHHEFVEQMGDGTLDMNKFRFYLEQDYLFLIQFARANSLAGYKSGKLEDLVKCAQIVCHIEEEMALHINYCAGFGISKEQMENGKEHQATTAYTRFVLDTGHTHTFLHLQIAMLPCLLGYHAIAERLITNAGTRAKTKTTEEGNIYYKWIQNYVADDYLQAVQKGKEMVEKAVWGTDRPGGHPIGRGTLDEFVEVFATACRMEKGFWEMGLKGDMEK